MIWYILGTAIFDPETQPFSMSTSNPSLLVACHGTGCGVRSNPAAVRVALVKMHWFKWKVAANHSFSRPIQGFPVIFPRNQSNVWICLAWFNRGHQIRFFWIELDAFWKEPSSVCRHLHTNGWMEGVLLYWSAVVCQPWAMFDDLGGITRLIRGDYHPRGENNSPKEDGT